MARNAVRLVLAAVLALLAAQAAMPSARVVAAFEVVCRAQADQSAAEQQVRRETLRVCSTAPILRSAPACAPFIGPEPARLLAFQLPPPDSPLTS